jgi:hypothetical protein
MVMGELQKNLKVWAQAAILVSRDLRKCFLSLSKVLIFVHSSQLKQTDNPLFYQSSIELYSECWEHVGLRRKKQRHFSFPWQPEKPDCN